MIAIKRILKIIVFIICIITFVISTFLVIKNYIQDSRNEKANEELKEEVIINNESDNAEKIDWNKFNEINKDIIGWIEIPNTNINYPILKDDNLYYLTHNFERKANKNGSIFLRNINLFEDQEITIYGHNMQNGTMFSKLDQYMDKDFFDKHSKIYIYTKECTYEGEIFSVYSKGVNQEVEDIKTLDIKEKIEYYKAQSVHLKEIDVDIEKNKLVKLTTCSYMNAKTTPTDQRYYVIAKISKKFD